MDPPKKPSQVIVFEAVGDPGKMLPGVDIFHHEKVVKTTGADGTASLQINGQEGEVFEFKAVCPRGFRSPAQAIPVTLRRMGNDSPQVKVRIPCVVKERTLVVAVRADGGPNLPVLYLNREVARTDGSGAAHVSFRLAAADSVSLTIDTTSQPHLRPQNPTESFIGLEHDQLKAFSKHFDVDAPKIKRSVPHPGPVQVGPMRLDRHLR